MPNITTNHAIAILILLGQVLKMLQTVTSQSAPNQTQIQNNMVVSERSTVEEVSFEWSV